MSLVYKHFKTAPQRNRDFIVLSINSVKFKKVVTSILIICFVNAVIKPHIS